MDGAVITSSPIAAGASAHAVSTVLVLRTRAGAPARRCQNAVSVIMNPRRYVRGSTPLPAGCSRKAHSAPGDCGPEVTANGSDLKSGAHAAEIPLGSFTMGGKNRQRLREGRVETVQAGQRWTAQLELDEW